MHVTAPCGTLLPVRAALQRHMTPFTTTCAATAPCMAVASGENGVLVVQRLSAGVRGYAWWWKGDGKAERADTQSPPPPPEGHAALSAV